MISLIKTRRFDDNRGWFKESYNECRFAELGITTRFVQENRSFSHTKGILRGLHFQSPPFGQAKFVSCLRGRILDVFVDLRRGSPTFGHYDVVELSGEGDDQVFIPEGYAHGFMTLEPDTEIMYKVSNFYAPQHEYGVRWDDPQIGIKWPFAIDPANLSDKDHKLPLLSEIESPFCYDGQPLSIQHLGP
jgi:dTDP-4-dehydrorhamnose 3,5-epimerase